MRDDLTPEQEDGVACVVCGDVWAPSVPVATSPRGYQLFACVFCVDQVKEG